MSTVSRPALGLYRRLLRARLLAFEGDELAIQASHDRIRAAFEEGRDKEGKPLKKALRLAESVERELIDNVLQAQMTEQGVYRMRITERTKFLDNAKLPSDAVDATPDACGSGKK